MIIIVLEDHVVRGDAARVRRFALLRPRGDHGIGQFVAHDCSSDGWALHSPNIASPAKSERVIVAFRSARGLSPFAPREDCRLSLRERTLGSSRHAVLSLRERRQYERRQCYFSQGRISVARKPGMPLDSWPPK